MFLLGDGSGGHKRNPDSEGVHPMLKRMHLKQKASLEREVYMATYQGKGKCGAAAVACTSNMSSLQQCFPPRIPRPAQQDGF